ncbi:phage tail tube protein [Paenactinomyces guangxiensis]|uniref:Uncharacterized protein n=1 Tax=Paenactinomyces guangxiensis TaxID=1490290 RepID=A0A7W1WS76_9BACL|nr:phage tail tube protein [Paenactinomyces guangxiensis]MBA4495099.1 hypothetical protein [Paenactinomyces guangxiensis]MBH8592217.1 hypothetical protein [Paenactinomyces guangxiensis]
MAATQGFKGKVRIGANEVIDLSSWELEIEVADLDDTSFGDSWTGMIPGLKSWAGSFGGSWNMGDTNGQKALQDALLNSTPISLELYTNETNFYSGTAYITSQGNETPVDDKVTVEFEFTGSGPLTFT